MENPNKRATETEDPFVSLPDLVLVHIISFLPNKDAARSASISRRWRDVWPCSRTIVLDESSFTDDDKRHLLVGHGRNALAEGVRRTGRLAFVAYARKFAACYSEQKVQHFHLRFSCPQEYMPDVRSWLALATQRAAEVVVLDFSDHDQHHKHPCISYAELMPELHQLRDSLHTLRLSGCSIHGPSFSAFTTLRVLSIARAELGHASLDLLICYCHRLEDLTLHKLSNLESIRVFDRNSQLLRLSIEECRPVDRGVVIEAPRLRYLKYSGLMTHFIIEAGNVEEVELDFCLEDEYSDIGDDLADILMSVHNTRVLRVCSYITQIIASGEEPLRLPALNGNLRHLIFKQTALHRDELPGIALLLRSYTHLESVTFEMGGRRALTDYEYPFPRAMDGRLFWRSQVSAFSCLKRHLRTVRIEGFKGEENEMAMMQFLLGRSKALREVVVCVAREPPVGAVKSIATAQAIPRFNRASPAVQIAIC